MGAPSAEALWGLSFSPFRGLFPLAPWLLLALPGFALWLVAHVRRAEWALSVGIVALMVLFTGSSGMWWGGFAVGPRYLLPALPWLALPVVAVLARWQRWPARALFALLALASLAGTWGMTLAEQAFPPDSMRNPWRDHLLANWQAGNLARNAGTVLGLEGAVSLLPLLLLVVALALLWWGLARRKQHHAPERVGAPAPAPLSESHHAG